MTKQYDSEIDPAKELFWKNIMEAVKNTTKTRILVELEAIKQNTQDVPWLSKFFANMFKQAGGEVEKKYPSRKK